MTCQDSRTELPELLVPAGDLEKFRSALYFGADAVYAGVERFSLRSQAGNFSLADLDIALKECHDRGKKLFLTLNASLMPEEMNDFEQWLEEMRPRPVDAYILADPGAIAVVRRVDPARSLHLSTQANTTNPVTAEFWRSQGIARVNLARELSLAQITAFRAGTGMELEVFVHGAMCVAVSGRCLLSAAVTGRSANRGACTQPCRWNYRIEEEYRPGEYFGLEEDERGSYLFNSRDLCLLPHLSQLIAAGVDSFKIEGRMKSSYYVAGVTRVYRAALDAFHHDPENWRCEPLWLEELEKVSHRPYDSGFLFPRPAGDANLEAVENRYRSACDFVGKILERRPDGRFLVGGRNRFFPGEEIELIGPGLRQQKLLPGEMFNEAGELLTVVQPNARVLMRLPDWAAAGDLLRREKASV